MPQSTVTIRTGARLHFGPLSFRPKCGRHFGGIGMMVDGPQIELTVGAGPAKCSQGLSSRVTEFVQRIGALLPCEGVQITVKQEIPSHRGLGSGTQLGLALTEAIHRLQRGNSPDITELARLSNRGLRSAIGLYGYRYGGFLIDAGHAAGSILGELACRVEFPDDWRILLVTPRESVGIHGKCESEILEDLPAMSADVQGTLARLALTEILPSLQNRNFVGFSHALFEYGQRVGEFFATSQNGIFSSDRMFQLAAMLQQSGTPGIAQSSWGPTIAVMSASEAEAQDIQTRCESHPAGQDCLYQITRARNVARTLLVDRTS